ncbi:YdgA family protein [Edwardsiella hoshinae]|uniref:Bacterial protein of uncharacterized function (DUF945) n=1 Tax=Edwardsiella hoshinae TaxID=93378 RepID=A0A376DEV1_9GAMM|nr:YdgA family protein [Edwardsiella hoshinae]QPR27208.1 YdgA family protein [Edwardsiella hoshinae]STC88136.1 Bacterial protein of uncharacterised function (DUF945) [Edwardsiella hoshinae]
MKKSAVAVAIIAVLAASWSGASWYTGKLIEQRMDSEVARLNTQLAQQLPQAGLKVSYQNYQRGLFTSRMQVVIQADTNHKSAAWLPAGQPLMLDETINHGPFPLTDFSLLPRMAVIHSQLANTPAVAALFKDSQGQSPFTANTRLAYNGDSRNQISLAPLTIQQGATKVTFAGAQIQADFAADLSRIDLNGDLKGITLSAPNGEQPETLVLEGVTFGSHSKLGKFAINVGEQQITAKRLSLTGGDKESVVLDDIALHTRLTEDARTLNAKADYTLGAVQINGKAFGSGGLTLHLNGFDGKAVQAFSTQYQRFLTQQLASGNSSDSPAYQQQLAALMDTALPTLLNGDPQISIQPLSWKNDAGSSQFTLDMMLGAPQTAPADATLPPLLQMIRSLDLSLAISMPMATQLATQAAELEGYPADQAQKLASQQVQGVSAMGQMFKLTTQQEQNIVSKLHYAAGQITLNGKQMSLAQFAGLFGLFDGIGGETPADQ